MNTNDIIRKALSNRPVQSLDRLAYSVGPSNEGVINVDRVDQIRPVRNIANRMSTRRINQAIGGIR